MASTGSTTRRRMWRSPVVMWLLWILLGVLLLVGFSILSSYPTLIHLVQAGTMAGIGS